MAVQETNLPRPEFNNPNAPVLKQRYPLPPSKPWGKLQYNQNNMPVQLLMCSQYIEISII